MPNEAARDMPWWWSEKKQRYGGYSCGENEPAGWPFQPILADGDRDLFVPVKHGSKGPGMLTSCCATGRDLLGG